MSADEQNVSAKMSGKIDFTPTSVQKMIGGENEELEDGYKLKEEETYSKEITSLRKTHSDADHLFNKRDEAIEKYEEALNKKESKEHIRIANLRLKTLNYYIKRLIIDFIVKTEEEKTKIDDHYQSWADNSSIKVDKTILKQYAESPFNDMACAFASMGIIFASDMVSKTFCVPRGPPTGCKLPEFADYQSDCYNQYTGLDDKGEEPNDKTGGYPQHLAWGEKERSQAKCAAGLVGVGRHERGVCGLGYYMGQSPNPESNNSTGTFNYTRCHSVLDKAADWAEIGNLNNTCAVEAGGNIITGIDLTSNFYTTNGPPDLQFGASTIEKCGPLGQRAKCQLGYHYKNADEIYEIPEGVSHCTQPADVTSVNENADMVCRKQVGFEQKMPTGGPRVTPVPFPPYIIPLSLYSAPYGRQSGVSIDQPSQHTYGMKEMYDQGAMGCNNFKRRLKCEMGYSKGVKLDPWTTECVERLNNMGDVCKNTYGNGWFSWPQTQSSWNQGCAQPAFRTKATCRNDDMVPIGTEFTNMSHEVAGQQCTTPGLTSTDTACAHYYGPNYVMTGMTRDVYVKYGDVTTLQNKNGNNEAINSTSSLSGNQDSSLSGNQDSVDYTDFTVERDRCGPLFRRPICKKTKHLSEMKNSICLWTNRSCAGMTCQQRVNKLNENIGEENLNGGKWIAMNPDNKCGAMGGVNSNSCLVCTSGGLTDKYMSYESPYYAALLDTAGKVGGQPAGKNQYDPSAVKPVGTNDLFLCKHAAFGDNHYNERTCTSNLTDNIKDAYSDPGHKVYVPKGSDFNTMKSHLDKYAKIGAGFGPSQAWLPDSSNYTWSDHYGGKFCEQINKNLPEFMSCIGQEKHAPSNSKKVTGPTGLGKNYLYRTNNYNKNSPLESLASVATANAAAIGNNTVNTTGTNNLPNPFDVWLHAQKK